jgi:NAD(P)-dependent dehydrogenase (short-subunit alcohol dehydrogenase family)
MKIAGSTALVSGANRGFGRHLAGELLAYPELTAGRTG